jgi:hypothetical protein
MKHRDDLKVKVKTLDGEKEYVFLALVRKDAAEVFHGVLTALISAVAGISVSDEENKIDAVFKALNTLDFDTVWSLGEKLLRFAILDGVEIKDLNDTDYFDDHPEELYLAIFHAVMLNYPKVLLKVREALSGSGLPDLKALLNREESKTASAQDK